MNNRHILPQIAYFLIYLLIQIVLIRNMVMYDRVFCFVYIAFLLLLPFNTNRVVLILAGFFAGFITDVFYDSLGIHAFACVLIMYLRPYWISVITPKGDNDSLSTPTLKLMGMEWFLAYALPLIFIHHVALFYMETGGFHLFFYTLSKVIFSSLFTFIVIAVIQALFYSSRGAYE